MLHYEHFDAVMRMRKEQRGGEPCTVGSAPTAFRYLSATILDLLYGGVWFVTEIGMEMKIGMAWNQSRNGQILQSVWFVTRSRIGMEI